jgi:cysteine sulfinate desulfinase/cysteine desulfurase-like protein
MTTTNEPLAGIEARIEELHSTITEKEAQIKARTMKLKEEIEMELSPVELVRKHPFPTTGVIFIAGLLLGKTLRNLGGSSAPSNPAACTSAECLPSHNKSALSAIGIEALRSAKDLGFTYLQRYIDKKII